MRINKYLATCGLGSRRNVEQLVLDKKIKINGKIVVEDVKSEITKKDKTYRLKIKLLLNKYPNIDFREVI